MDRRTRIASLSAVVIAILVLSPALAANLNGWRAGSNSTVTFTKVALTSQFANAFNSNDVNNIEFSDITTSVFTDTTYSEVNVFDQNYSPSTWVGQWECVAWTGNVCTDGRVRMNLRYSYTDVQAKSLMCEEVGHSVGLDHRNTTDSTCMARPVCWTCTLLPANHEIIHLNGIY